LGGSSIQYSEDEASNNNNGGSPLGYQDNHVGSSFDRDDNDDYEDDEYRDQNTKDVRMGKSNSIVSEKDEELEQDNDDEEED
jgi:hypothetical protein